MAHVSQAARRSARRPGHGPLFAPALLFVGVIALAAAYVAYVLWPRWPGVPVSLKGPPLPIIIAGSMFNIEPAAIRRAVQRRPGTQQRVDLAYLWPSLTPPDPAEKLDIATPIDPNQRLFVTINDGGDSLPPAQRVKDIYPRYLTSPAVAGPGGLALRSFRDGSPYQGEDLIYDPAAPEDFVVRCSRTGVGNSGTCLYDQRIGKADLTARFPRDWLSGDWRKVEDGLDRLIGRLHPAP